MTNENAVFSAANGLNPKLSLEAIPEAMAAAVRPALQAITRDGYIRFLQAMVHYTRASGARLRHARDHAASPTLKAFFGQLAAEEQSHYRLAESDLAQMPMGGEALQGPRRGAQPLLQMQHAHLGEPSAHVARFHQAWMESRDPAHWLGALYALENVARHLAADVPPQLERLGLGPAHARFLLTHLQADDAHGDASAAHMAHEDGERVRRAALDAAEFWVALHLEAIRG